MTIKVLDVVDVVDAVVMRLTMPGVCCWMETYADAIMPLTTMFPDAVKG